MQISKRVPSPIPSPIRSAQARQKQNVLGGGAGARLPTDVIRHHTTGPQSDMLGEVYAVPGRKQRSEMAGMSSEEIRRKSKTIERRERVVLCYFYVSLLAMTFAENTGKARQTEGFILQNFPAVFTFSGNVSLKKNH